MSSMNEAALYNIEGEKDIVYMLCLDTDGFVKGVDSTSSKLIDSLKTQYDYKVTKNVYDTVFAGLNAGVRYRVVDGDLVNLGKDLSTHKRGAAGEINAAASACLKTASVSIAGKKQHTFTMDYNTQALLQSGLCVNRKVVLMDDNHDLVELEPNVIKRLLSDYVEETNLVNSVLHSSLKRISVAKDQSAIERVVELVKRRFGVDDG